MLYILNENKNYIIILFDINQDYNNITFLIYNLYTKTYKLNLILNLVHTIAMHAL